MILCDTQVNSPMARSRAFDYLAHMENAAEWHPGIPEIHLIQGEPGLRNAVYHGRTRFGPLRLRTRIEIVEIDRPGKLAYTASTVFSKSMHTVTIASCGDEIVVTTESRFELRAWVRPLQPLTRGALAHFCARSALGLRSALGARVQDGPVWRPGSHLGPPHRHGT